MLATIFGAGYDFPVAIKTSADPPSTTGPERYPIDDTVHRLSTDEYDRIVAAGGFEGLRVELLGGLLVDMSPQGEDHARVVHQLMLLFNSRRELTRVQMPLDVADGWVPEPDLALAEYGKRGGPHPTSGLFVAEVAISSQQLDAKKALVYAHARIPVYWLVDIPAATVRVHSKPGPTGYASVVAKTGDDILDSNVEGVPQTTVAALLEL
jgi:Uma2 family endonuclease